jgi:mgtE-like transporter
MSGVRTILRETLPLVLAMAVIELIAGSFLGRMEERIEQLPGLLALVPAVLAMRGNISTAMGSRFGTLTRFGLIPRNKMITPAVRQHLIASIVLGIILAMAAAAIAHFVTLSLGFQSAGLFTLATIAVVSGAVSGVIMGAIALLVMRLAFRRGFDLDNVAGPILMTFSDLFTLLCIFAVAAFFGGSP